MKQLSRQEMQKIDFLNDKLKTIEKKIYHIAFEENQIALKKILEKENDLFAYDIKEGDEEDPEHLLADWSDFVKSIISKDTWWGIYNDNCHNITSACQKNKVLNSQKHCWLLHSLYDHNNLDWDDILKIDSVCFDVKVKYEYLSEINILSTKNKTTTP